MHLHPVSVSCVLPGRDSTHWPVWTQQGPLLASALASQGIRLSLQEEQLATLSQGVKGLAHSQDDFKAAMIAQIGGLADQIQQLLGGSRGKDPVPPAPEPSPAPTLAYAGAGVQLTSPK